MKVVRLWELSGMQISIKSERGLQCTDVLLWIYPGFWKLVKTKKRIFLQRLRVFELEKSYRHLSSLSSSFIRPCLTLSLISSRSLDVKPQGKDLTHKYLYKGVHTW